MSGTDGLITAVQLRLQLLNCGWSPIPVSGKVPTIANWSRYCASAPTEFEVRAFGSARSTGIALSRDLVVVDIDALDPALARALQDVAEQTFGPTPFHRVGQWPQVALVYRAAVPIPTTRIKAASGDGSGIDILSFGAQLVVHGPHRDTGQPYRWIGDLSPFEAGPDEAPAITSTQLDAFLYAAKLLMPFEQSMPRNGLPAGSSTTNVVRDEHGTIVDGREGFLRDCIYHAACTLNAAGQPVTPEMITLHAWQRFETSADLSDGKWTIKKARQKANGTVRRIRSGALILPGAALPVSPTYPDGRVSLEEADIIVAELVDGFVDDILARIAARTLDDPAPTPHWAARIETGVESLW